ncbi:probable cytochrome P450 9f2 [Contarinia nasturtii]|uniref:probable cytochrome P450 9f2 n=1 Tax=Contarinia nasturtii TaxID=265458 RepID=UPI0012D418C9|nr:probable cytochrome P450 9f2 [Contarinia nasturtii]
MILVLFLIVITLYCLFKYVTANKNFFEEQKLKYLKPKFGFGHTIWLIFRQYTPADFIDSIYYSFPKEKLVGFYDMREPVYMPRDLDLLRQIMVKDFDHFEDHDGIIESNTTSLFGKSLFILSTNKWREMRANLTPAFTGKKMRLMFELVVDCVKSIETLFIEQVKQQQPIRYEMKDFYARYMADVIASCAFGAKTDSLRERHNDFYVTGESCVDFESPQFCLRMLLVRALPRLTQLINFEIFPASVNRFFKSMVLDTMAERQKKNIVRHDMINILMELRKECLFRRLNEETHCNDTSFSEKNKLNNQQIKLKSIWQDDEIVSQCFVFFVAGFETTSTLLSFLSYELAINQDIQQKLYAEILEVNSTLSKDSEQGTALNYDALSKMKYMDQVLNETLRKYPPGTFTNRKCTKDYSVNLDGNTVTINKGQVLWIPIYSIQNDPLHFENPHIFDPERFNEENKPKIKPYSFIPFGVGPRSCIGLRFANMAMKAILFNILLNYSMQPYEKTQIPLKIVKCVVNWATETGIHIEFVPRKAD